MNSKNISLVLIYIFLSICGMAQIVFDEFETTKEVKSFIISSSINNDTDDTKFVLDSTLRTYYFKDSDSTLFFNDYYRYDINGNLIEHIHSSTPNNYSSIGGNYKLDYQYYNNGSRIVEVTYLLDVASLIWIPYRKGESEYDLAGNPINTVLSFYNDNLGGFDNYLKTEHAYNEKNDIIGTRQYLWDENLKIWNLSLIMNWEYYEDRNLKHRSSNRYDSITQSWLAVSIYDYYFDIDGHDSLSVATQWSYLDSAYSQTKYEYKVDTLGNILERIYFTQDTLGNWQEFDKITSEYDVYGNKISEIDFNWNWIESNWEPNRKNEWSFNSNSQQTQLIEYRWDEMLNDWIFFGRSEHEYNNELLTLNTFFRWDNTLNEWINRSKTTYEYDIYNNLTVESEYDWTDADSWWLDGKIEYFYSEFTTNINNKFTEQQKIKVYPNPANDVLTIETQNQETTFGKLYNFKGELVKNLTIEQGTNTCNISELKSGVYFIQIPQKEGVVVRKLVKN